MNAVRLGYWSAAAILLVGTGYLGALTAGFARHGLNEPITDPVLAAMEILTLVSAPPMVTLMAAIHDCASATRRVYGVIAVAFATAFAALTSAVHFVELTAARQLGESGIVWPSRAYAVELLAWDVFLGIALVAAARALADHGEALQARRALTACGALCLAGTLGPVVGNMRLQLMGVFGYAVVLPLCAWLLLRHFGAQRIEARS